MWLQARENGTRELSGGNVDCWVAGLRIYVRPVAMVITLFKVGLNWHAKSVWWGEEGGMSACLSHFLVGIIGQLFFWRILILSWAE